jgi:predicted RNase H-like HicB family nuclease
MKSAELIFLVEEDPEGGFTAKAVGESIFTQGETLAEIKTNIKQALSCHFDRKENIPASIRLHVIHEETLTYA